MFVYCYRHRVRYRECDPMSVVYHTHYLDYFEASRTEGLRAMGLAYKDLEESGIIMPVIDLAVHYRRSAYYDDLLEIKTMLGRELPRTRLRIDYEVRRVDEAPLLATGHVTLCFYHMARQRPIPAPPQVLEVFGRALESDAWVLAEPAQGDP